MIAAVAALLLSASVLATPVENIQPALDSTDNSGSAPDFGSIKDRSIRKSAFISYMASQARPIIHKIGKERTVLLSLYLRYRSGDSLNDKEQSWVLELAKVQGLHKFNSDNEESWSELLKRTDIIPLSLLMAQGALESAWGTSRFAREGNNYFGIWCFTPGCGMVPKQRNEGATHEVESYVSMKAAIEKYIYILNTRPAFEELRNLRHQQRLNLLTPSGTILLKGLGLYAKNGAEYMELVKKIIRQNGLGQYD
ncbi:MAG: glucosaminidase domain-containing protein [Gammaproteobacteria bacterium]|uniref:Glucosaminidase domain-containing protein n=1 Tax=Candidatus Thiopontia autotrophica TaxID=2841688 RepID=A0A8J6PBT7_9GAMM|nr:glucosaminidase domain-containing protein [Candidatus Thiopontia autotrophica]